jgi:hypothetical protein
MGHLSFAFVGSYHVHDVFGRRGPDSGGHYNLLTEIPRNEKEHGHMKCVYPFIK